MQTNWPDHNSPKGLASKRDSEAIQLRPGETKLSKCWYYKPDTKQRKREHHESDVSAGSTEQEKIRQWTTQQMTVNFGDTRIL